MSAKNLIHQVMAEIGPLLELGAVIESDDGDGWILAIDEHESVLVELDETEERILLSAGAGLPPDDARPRLYEMLLAYNREWHATGGICMALEEPGGEVVQMLELPVAGLDVARLAQVFVAFLEILTGWCTVVAAQAGAGDRSGESVPDGGIQV